MLTPCVHCGKKTNGWTFLRDGTQIGICEPCYHQHSEKEARERHEANKENEMLTPDQIEHGIVVKAVEEYNERSNK